MSDHLTPTQRAIVEAPPGPTLVLAGPGSGKTRVLTHRAAYIIQQGVEPQRVLLLTFTNRAAEEMRRRIEALTGADAPWAGTIHALAQHALSAHAPRLGYRPGYGILSEPDRARLLDEIAREFGLRGRLVGDVHALSINSAQSARWALTRRGGRASQLEAVMAALARFTEEKLRLNVMDYDDLLLNFHLLLSEHGALQRHYAEHFRAVLVDEYQDLNPLQVQLVEALASKHRGLTVVGDPEQSIYGFRGARAENLRDFTRRHPTTNQLDLRFSHRATAEIIAVANALLPAGRLAPPLRAERAGPHPAWISVLDSDAQAAEVARRARALEAQGVPLESQAALFRTHAQGARLAAGLEALGLPYTMETRARLSDDAQARRLLAHLSALYRPHDLFSWRALLRAEPGVPSSEVTRLMAHLEGAELPMEAFEREAGAAGAALLRRLTGLWSRSERGPLAQVEGLIAELGGPSGAPAEALLEAAARASSAEGLLLEASLESRRPTEGAGLRLSTIHQAKGREWEAVYVVDLAEGHCPLTTSSTEDAVEERRLFYVAVTRAARFLALITPQYIDERRGRRAQIPSRFLDALKREDLLEKAL